MRKHMAVEGLPEWIETYDLDEWNSLKIQDIETSMRLGKCMLIRNTNLDHGWSYDMKSAMRMKSGASLLDCQGMGRVHRRVRAALNRLQTIAIHTCLAGLTMPWSRSQRSSTATRTEF